MPTISFQKNRSQIQVEVGANLMKSLLAAGIPVASSCNGDGVCAKCRIEIIEGMQNLSAPNETEQFLKEKFKLARNYRISCQTKVNGDIKIDTTYW